ncbi:hypothetical protein LINPERHAP2_LOCUS33664, partial [Linum perenne]
MVYVLHPHFHPFLFINLFHLSMVLHPTSHFSIIMEKATVQRKRSREKPYSHNAVAKAFKSSSRKARHLDDNVVRCCVRECSGSCKHHD